MTVLRVNHRTIYSYAAPVAFGEHRLLFRPRDSYDQRLLSSELLITPQPSDLHWIHDVFGNCIAIADFDTKGSELSFESSIVLDHTPQHGPQFRSDQAAQRWPIAYHAELLPDLEPVMRRHYPDAGEIEAWARRFIGPAGSSQTADVLMAMTSAIHQDLHYSRRTDPGTQTPVVTLASGTGSCRDFALLMMEAVRSLGFASRFVTGYLYVPARDTPERRGGGATHAWVQVFLPGSGWVEFDPTNGIIGNQDLIRVGVARDPRQARPLSGSFIGSRSEYLGMSVDVSVTRAEGALDVA
jgi:transglutaminase-like putative cysteine protease